MRIIRGRFRKKSILPPKNFKARPTTDMAKESLFNILENELEISELKVLDLFAGTGSISYEFVSRGCSDVSCVEKNYQHYSFIKQTIRELQISDELKVIKADVFSFLKNATQKYDLIFADPPYNLEGIEKIPDIVWQNKRLTKTGILIVEHSSNTLFNNHPMLKKQKTYGSVNFSFFET